MNKDFTEERGIFRLIQHDRLWSVYQTNRRSSPFIPG
jgi:hypothetical protein